MMSVESSKENNVYKLIKMISSGALAVTVAGGILVSIFTYWWQNEKPHLVTIPNDPYPFHGEKSTVANYRVTLVNDGSKEANHVICSILLNGAKIIDYRVLDEMETLDKSQRVKGDLLVIEISRLNPKRIVEIDVQAEWPSPTPIFAKTESEGDGVKGVERKSINDTNIAHSNSTLPELISRWIFSGVGALFGIFTMMIALGMIVDQAFLLKNKFKPTEPPKPIS